MSQDQKHQETCAKSMRVLEVERGGFDIDAHSGDIMDIEEHNGRAGLARIIMN